MRHSHALLCICLTAVILASAVTVVAADYLVVVKAGDWVDYTSSVSGNVPAKANVTGARLDILSVTGTEIDVNVTTFYTNGTVLPQQLLLDESTGTLGDALVVPANLEVGSQFYDRVQGNFTITSQEQRTVAGAERTVVSAQKGQTLYSWDKQTGVMVEANSSFDDFTLDTTMAKTNLWQPQTSNLQPLLIYGAVAAIIIAVIAAVAALLVRRRMQH